MHKLCFKYKTFWKIEKTDIRNVEVTLKLLKINGFYSIT